MSMTEVKSENGAAAGYGTGTAVAQQSFQQQHQPPKDPSAVHGVDIEQLKAELAALDPAQFPIAHKMLKAKLDTTDFNICTEPEYLTVDHHQSIRLCKKVLIPIDRHPQFNFVGKIIGAGGKNLQALAQANKCRVVVCGKNTTKDPEKEQQLLASGDPKYQHYNDIPHVKIETIGGAVTAYGRITSVLQQLEQTLQPVVAPQGGAPGATGYAPRPPPQMRGRGRGAMRGMTRPPRPPPPPPAPSVGYAGYDTTATTASYASAYDYSTAPAEEYDYSGYSQDYYAPPPPKRPAPGYDQPAVPGYGGRGRPAPPPPAAPQGYGGY